MVEIDETAPATTGGGTPPTSKPDVVEGVMVWVDRSEGDGARQGDWIEATL
jgi:hypothetical protein